MGNIEASKLLVENPLLRGDDDIYIWINDAVEERRNAQFLFDYLLRKNIYVKGFASKSQQLIGLKMYNKSIVDINGLDKAQKIFYDTDFYPFEEKVASDIQRARIINPALGRNNIVIWGAGVTGDKAYQILTEQGICIKCFVDADKNKQGTFKYDVPVYAPDYLEEQEEDIVVVEALENWKSLDDEIKEKNWRRFYFSFETVLNYITCNVDGAERNLFLLSYFWIFHRFTDKKVYIYGNGLIEQEFAKYLKLLDYNFCGYLVDTCEDVENAACQYVEEILYEDNFYIWLYDKKGAKRLKELGLRCLEQWECNEFNWDMTLDRREGLDVNLGYTSLADSNYPGIVVYGKNREEDYKIAILGGSTSDGLLWPFRAWPELMYEDWKEQDITIYNCGVAGYTSGQELIKLIRDVLPLKPNMIIVYDGCNDLSGLDIRYPYSFLYAKRVYEYAKEHMEATANIQYTQSVCEGINHVLTKFDGWLCNIRMMHAIASEYNIKFFSFCQPLLTCKKGKTDEERNMLLSIPSMLADSWIKEYFRKELAQRSDIPDYIYDLTGIFDNKDGIYMDACHVREAGNKIVADKIENVISRTICRDTDGRFSLKR